MVHLFSIHPSMVHYCRTLMLACITPATSSFEETLNTLKYANRAKNIKTRMVKNVKSVSHQVKTIHCFTPRQTSCAKLAAQYYHSTPLPQYYHSDLLPL